MSSELRIDTPVGPAGVTVVGAGERGTLVLGHGAGGLRWTADVTAAAAAAVTAGWTAVLLDQPWRLAGRSVASPPKTLDVAWCAALADAVLAELPRPLVVGGRSAGARVACRTAQHTGAAAVIAVSFPLHPPGEPGQSRSAELAEPVAHGIPVDVIQGDKDPFGTPAEVAAAVPGLRRLVTVRGAHPLEREAAAVASATVAALKALPG
ncbi:MAG: hypothetical protein IPL94_10225 [Tetrasphaera sp.]|nr:hypothetical protein [Tetrasphaera sp.]